MLEGINFFSTSRAISSLIEVLFGLSFEKSYFLKTNTIHNLHNCGITSRENGHIRLSDNVYLSYAYGEEFGTWATRIQEVKFSLIDSPDFSDKENENVKTPFLGGFLFYAPLSV